MMDRGKRAKVAMLLTMGALSLMACQHGLKPNDSISASAAQLKGWVQDPHALLTIEAYDHCEQGWREIQRANVGSRPVKVSGILAYPWDASLILASAPQSKCLIRGAQSQVSLRVRERGVTPKFLPNLGKGAQTCFAQRLGGGAGSETRLQDCETHQELPVRVTPECESGMVLKTESVPLAKAGNLRKLTDDPDVGQPPIMYHFKDSLLVGKGSQVFKYAPEFRNYMLFEVPKEASKSERTVKSAWISFFVSYSTAPCGHRDDIGCGYASEDASEDYALSLVSIDSLVDPRTVPYGLQVTDWAPAHSLFQGIEDSPVVARFRMQRADVDRWFQIPLGEKAVEAINKAEPGKTLMFGGRVTSVDRNARKRREWLFVDHLVGLALGPDLVPRLNVSYCAPG